MPVAALASPDAAITASRNPAPDDGAHTANARAGVADSAWKPDFQGPHDAEPPQRRNWHPTMLRFLGDLPPLVRASLSGHQLDAIGRALEPRPSPHIIAYRVSIPMPWRRYYLTLFFGREQRSLQRLKAERQLGKCDIGIAMLALLSLLSGVISIAVVVSLYVIKAMLGIDLFDGPSMFHWLLFWRD